MIAAVAATVALAAPSREALLQRWLHADRSHSIARLNSRPRGGASNVGAAPDLRALAQRELGTPGRYQLQERPPSPPAAQPWWQKIWQWIKVRWQKLWQALLGRMHVGKEEAAGFGDVLLAIVGLALLVALVRLLRNLQLARSASRQKSEPLDEPSSPQALYNEACDLAARGEYGAAALVLFAATVALLVRQGVVDGMPSATVGDLLRQLRASDAGFAPEFNAVAAPFVQKAYADRPVHAAQWQRADSAFVALLSSDPQRVARHPERVEG